MTENVTNEVNEISKKFSKEIYNDYLNGKIKYQELLKLFNCSQYELNLFFEKEHLLKRQTALKQFTVHSFFDVIDSEIKAYLLGFYVADGCLSQNRISISVTKDDIEIIELFQKNICQYNRITIGKSYLNKKTGYESKPMAMITFHSPHMANQLEKYGIGENKTVSINTNFDFIPDNYFIDFVRGYFDGDGTICVTPVRKYHYYNYNWNIISYKKEHLIAIQNRLNKIANIKPNIIKSSRGHFLIEINKKIDFFKMRDLLYSNASFFLNRKKEKYLSYEKPIFKFVIKKKDGNIVSKFNNLVEAAKDANVCSTSISNWIKAKKTIDGYSWEILEE